MKRVLVLLILALLFTAALPAAAQTDLMVHATAQRFEGGLMIWRGDNAHIWVLVDGGQAYSFPVSSYSRLPDNPIQSNRLRPIFGFGKIWGNRAAVRNALGWPVQPEIGFNMRVVNVNRTFYLQQLNGTIYQVNPNNTWNIVPGMPGPVPRPDPYIYSFEIEPRVAAPGSTVTVWWNLGGVSEAALELYDTANNILVEGYGGLATNGSRQITLPTFIAGDMRVVLVGLLPLPINGSYDFSRRGIEVEITIDITPSPLDHSVITYAAFQQYDNGFMIWRSDTGDIWVFFGGSEGIFSFYSVNLYGGFQDNPIFDIPAGRVRPINGFGRVWGNLQDVRNGSGWATAPEQGYNTTVGLSQGRVVSLTLPNGQTVNLSGSSWSVS